MLLTLRERDSRACRRKLRRFTVIAISSPRPVDAIEQRDSTCLGVVAGPHEAAAEVIGAEGLGGSVRPNLHASIRDHFQIEAVAGGGFDVAPPDR